MNKIIHGIEVDNENYIALFNMFLENSKTKNATHKKELTVLENGCKQIKDKNGKLVDVSCNLYDVLGSNPKASDILKVKNILEMVFGEEAYKDSFVVGQLKHGVAVMPGYNLNLPKSNDELVDLIITYGKIIESKKIDNDTITKYGIIMKNIQSRIAEFTKNTYLLEQETALVMRNMQNMLSSIKKSKSFSFVDEEFFYKVLDFQVKVTLTGDDGKTFEVDEVTTSSFVKEYKEEYEKDLEVFNKEKEVQKYFKKVNRKSLSNISYDDFPSFDNSNFVEYMNRILELLEEANNSEIFAIASLKIISFYRDLNEKEEKLACSK